MTVKRNHSTVANDGRVKQWSEIRLIAAFRWLLATTALTIIYLDPKEPDNRTWGVTYVVLAAYVLYSTVLYYLAIKHPRTHSRFESWVHWIDVAWFTVLIGMSGGTNRIFFFGFLFAILVASFRRGFKAGISVVLVSILSITVIGYATENASPGFEGYGFDVYRFMLRPIFLLVLGYLMAYWGESEIESKRRLAMLKDIALANPRFGADRTIASIVDHLREFFRADLGLIVTSDARSGRYSVYRSEVGHAANHAEELSDVLANELLALPGSISVCYNRKGSRTGGADSRVDVFDFTNGALPEPPRQVCDTLADTFDAQTFISAPTFRHHQVAGRMYFCRLARARFRKSDIEFLANVIEHTNPIIENIRLVDTLASDAAEQERHRIARDIHDSIIQPYIGFQIALSGVRRRIDGGQVNFAAEVEQLTEMTALGVNDLRQYVSRLKNPDSPDTTLAASLDRFTHRFANATGIKVQVETPTDLRLNDSLAAEVFQMVTEGLSNIRRHTQATEATVKIECDDKRLILTIGNDLPAGEEFAAFTPRSITERAAALNGIARVAQTDSGTEIQVEIPL